jgi:hypothetical protein
MPEGRRGRNPGTNFSPGICPKGGGAVSVYKVTLFIISSLFLLLSAIVFIFVSYYV